MQPWAPTPGKKHPFLKARFQIGSCKGPINYAASEPTFHPDDIPASKKASKAASLNGLEGAPFLARNHYGTRRPLVICIPRSLDYERELMRTTTARATRTTSEPKNPPKNFEPLPKTHKFKIDVMPESRKTNDKASGHRRSVLQLQDLQSGNARVY